MHRPIDTVIELQKTLDELRSANEQLAGVPHWMQELHEEHTGRYQEITDLEDAVEEAVRERRQAETEISDSQEKLQHLQDQISRVRNQREYGALLTEIDLIREQIKGLEEQALAAMERAEEGKLPIAEKRDEFADLDERYKEAYGKWEAEKPAVAQQAEVLEGRIEVLRERLPRGPLALFDRIFEHHATRALAPVREVARSKGVVFRHCGACNYQVRPQVVVEISNTGALLQCDNCKRILYVPDSEE